MIVYAIKNKDNEYLYIDEWRDIYFYDEVYLATLFGNKPDAENCLEQNLNNIVYYINNYEDELCVKDYDCKVVPIEMKEIEPAHQHEDKNIEYKNNLIKFDFDTPPINAEKFVKSVDAGSLKRISEMLSQPEDKGE